MMKTREKKRKEGEYCQEDRQWEEEGRKKCGGGGGGGERYCQEDKQRKKRSLCGAYVCVSLDSRSVTQPAWQRMALLFASSREVFDLLGIILK